MKLIQKYNCFIGVANKLGKYVQAINMLPPQGEAAKRASKERNRRFVQAVGRVKQRVKNCYGRDYLRR